MCLLFPGLLLSLLIMKYYPVLETQNFALRPRGQKALLWEKRDVFSEMQTFCGPILEILRIQVVICVKRGLNATMPCLFIEDQCVNALTKCTRTMQNMQEKMIDAQLALSPLHAGSQTLHNAKYSVLSQALSLY